MAYLLVAFFSCGGKQEPSGDGGTNPDSSQSSDGPTCTYKETRTSNDRTCTQATDCTLVVRQVTCCMEQHEGIRKDAAMNFDTQQKALTAGCPGCGCLAQPIDDLGKMGNMSFTVSCDMGQCTSHAQ